LSLFPSGMSTVLKIGFIVHYLLFLLWCNIIPDPQSPLLPAQPSPFSPSINIRIGGVVQVTARPRSLKLTPLGQSTAFANVTREQNTNQMYCFFLSFFSLLFLFIHFVLFTSLQFLPVFSRHTISRDIAGISHIISFAAQANMTEVSLLYSVERSSGISHSYLRR
jgi:hypothetical protein